MLRWKSPQSIAGSACARSAPLIAAKVCSISSEVVCPQDSRCPCSVIPMNALSDPSRRRTDAKVSTAWAKSFRMPRRRSLSSGGPSMETDTTRRARTVRRISVAISAIRFVAIPLVGKCTRRRSGHARANACTTCGKSGRSVGSPPVKSIHCRNGLAAATACTSLSESSPSSPPGASLIFQISQ